MAIVFFQSFILTSIRDNLLYSECFQRFKIRKSETFRVISVTKTLVIV